MRARMQACVRVFLLTLCVHVRAVLLVCVCVCVCVCVRACVRARARALICVCFIMLCMIDLLIGSVCLYTIDLYVGICAFHVFL